MAEHNFDEAMKNVAAQMFDVCINPLAGMICTLLQVQISKGHLSKDEAKAIIVSTLDLINQSDHATEIHANGHEMLLRMINAIDQIPNVLAPEA